jgi:hypothetical protein
MPGTCGRNRGKVDATGKSPSWGIIVRQEQTADDNPPAGRAIDRETFTAVCIDRRWRSVLRLLSRPPRVGPLRASPVWSFRRCGPHCTGTHIGPIRVHLRSVRVGRLLLPMSSARRSSSPDGVLTREFERSYSLGLPDNLEYGSGAFDQLKRGSRRRHARPGHASGPLRERVRRPERNAPFAA